MQLNRHSGKLLLLLVLNATLLIMGLLALFRT